MTITTQIPQDEWPEFLDSFSNGNAGRALSLEVFDDKSDQPAAKQGQLMAVAYDPQGKGNDIVVTTGVDTIDYVHTIAQPVELWRVQHDDGQIDVMEVIDQNGVKTILSLS